MLQMMRGGAYVCIGQLQGENRMKLRGGIKGRDLLYCSGNGLYNGFFPQYSEHCACRLGRECCALVHYGVGAAVTLISQKQGPFRIRDKKKESA